MYFELQHRENHNAAWHTEAIDAEPRQLLEAFTNGGCGDYRVLVITTPVDGSDLPSTTVVPLKTRKVCSCGEVCK